MQNHNATRPAARIVRTSLLAAVAAGAILAVGTFWAPGIARAAEPAPLRTIHEQPSYVIANKGTELAVTRLGGHMAPVTFFRDGDKPVQPYYISPWQDEKPAELGAPVLAPLRGDFFCLPFGGNTEASGGEKHPPHGEIAGSEWSLVDTQTAGPVTSITLAIEPKGAQRQSDQDALAGRRAKRGLFARPGRRFRRSGAAGASCHAGHARARRERAAGVEPDPLRHDLPGTLQRPEAGRVSSAAARRRWTDLAKVPVAWKGAPDADLTRLPARQGYADLVQIINQPADKSAGPAWMTATFPDAGYVWFSLKDPAVLPTTLFWIENHGRHGAPWNGRNNCLGLEDVASYFAEGLAGSTQSNLLTAEGVKTALDLKADRPTAINYIQGVARVPEGFECVRTLEFAPGKVTLVATGGQKVTVPVEHEFLQSGRLTAAAR